MRERLNTLASLLESLSPEVFEVSWEIPKPLPNEDNITGPLGYALTIPEFTDEGLQSVECGEYGGLVMLSFGEFRGLTAAQMFFSLTPEETWAVFTPDGWRFHKVVVTPRIVADRLRSFARR